METFTLWHHESRNRGRTFSFYATAVQTQGLNDGTDAMVRQMLDDMGIDAKATSWSVERVATDYLADDRDTGDWRDRWMVTGAFDVRLDQSVRHDPAPPGFDQTVAYDKTWRTKTPVPTTCLVVADFKRKSTMTRALMVFKGIAKIDNAAAFVTIVRERFPRVSRKRLLEIWDGMGEGDLDVATCQSPLQLHILLPADESFFEDGARRALAVEDLCNAIGASNFWRDRYA